MDWAYKGYYKADGFETKSAVLYHQFHRRKRSANRLSGQRILQQTITRITQVFVAYARLYVFAKKYDIQPPKTLALKELCKIFAIYTLYRRRTGDIIAPLRYVYANNGVPV